MLDTLDTTPHAPYSSHMKTTQFRIKANFLVLYLLLMVITLVAPTAHASVDDFYFTSFAGEYTLTRNSQRISHLNVVEHLVAQFPNTNQNHGILRYLPTKYEGHDLNLQIRSVSDDKGTAIPFTKQQSGEGITLKIGDPDQYVQGKQTYLISYEMDNVTTISADHSAIIWNTNGTGWRQPFQSVTSTIRIYNDLINERVPAKDRCFTGPAGSTASNCVITSPSPGIINVSTGALPAGHNLTFQLGFKPSTFSAYTPPPSQIFKWAAIALLLWVLPIVTALWITLRRWWLHGRDPAGRGVIIAQYTPPAGLSVLDAGILLAEKFRPQTISAAIIDLAVRGYLRIYEVKPEGLFSSKSYEVELIKSADTLAPEEKSVIDAIFETPTIGQRVNLKETSKSQKLYEKAKAIGKYISQDLTTTGYFRSDPAKAVVPFSITGAILIAIIFFGAPLIYTGGLGIAGLIFLIMAYVMPARTAKGVEARDHLRGLKEYITMAEAERIKILQSPNGQLTEKIDVNDRAQLVKLYERLLPYAMIFGIEKDWIKEFAPLYIQPPEWYSSSSHFTAAYFAGSIGSFNQTASSSFTPPSSSGSGGFSGGGGGGGGGGGW